MPGSDGCAGDRERPALGSGSGSVSGAAGAADREVPVLSRFSATTASRTRFRYTLSEAARVTITVQRAVRSAGRIRYRTVGRLARSAREGLNRTTRLRKIGGRVLRDGRYRAIARATDAAGNRSAPRRARFTIVTR